MWNFCCNYVVVFEYLTYNNRFSLVVSLCMFIEISMIVINLSIVH